MLPLVLNRKAQGKEPPRAPRPYHAPSLVLWMRPPCINTSFRDKAQGTCNLPHHLFPFANSELYRWEEARAINLPCSEGDRSHFPHVLTLGILEGGGQARMTGAGCSCALYSSGMPSQSVCLPACLPHVSAFFPELESWEERSPYQDALR